MPLHNKTFSKIEALVQDRNTLAEACRIEPGELAPVLVCVYDHGIVGCNDPNNRIRSRLTRRENHGVLRDIDLDLASFRKIVLLPVSQPQMALTINNRLTHGQEPHTLALRCRQSPAKSAKAEWATDKRFRAILDKRGQNIQVELPVDA